MNDGGAWVTLTAWELDEAYRGGGARALSAVRNNRKDKYGAKPCPMGGVERHIKGCIGEVATAKHLNLFWSANVGIITEPDVGGCVEVRAVFEDHFRLTLHDDDKPLPFVLALIKLPRVFLRGWMYSWEGISGRWSEDPNTGRPAHFIPNDELGSMEELRGIVHTEHFKVRSLPPRTQRAGVA